MINFKRSLWSAAGLGLKLELELVFIIAECNKTIVAFCCVVLFNRGRSLVIALSLLMAQ